MNWLLRQSPWLHSQNLVIVTPHLDTFLWLCKVLLWSWPWLQEFKLASVSWIAVWSGAVISRWHLTKNVSSIKNTRHFYIFFATTWLAAWFFQFGKGFVEPKRVGLVREKKRVGSDQGPTLNYASLVGWRLLVEKRQLWCPTTGLTLDAKTGIISGTPEITSSKVQVFEWWVTKKMGTLWFLGQKTDLLGWIHELKWLKSLWNIHVNLLLPVCFAVHGWVGTHFLGQLARLGCILSRSKFLTLVSREVGPHQLGDVAESSKIFSKSRSSFFLLSVFSQKYNPLDVLGRIRFFQYVGSWYLLERGWPAQWLTQAQGYGGIALGDVPLTSCKLFMTAPELQEKKTQDSLSFPTCLSFLKKIFEVQQISMLIRDFLDEVRPLQNFTIMKSAGSEVVLVDASDQWCGGSHQASICVVPVTQHLRTRWLHSSKFVQSCFLVYDEWVSGSFRPWTYTQLLRLSCWQTLNCEVELLLSNFKQISEKIQGPLLSQLLRFSCVSRTGRMNGSLKHVIAL